MYCIIVAWTLIILVFMTPVRQLPVSEPVCGEPQRSQIKGACVLSGRKMSKYLLLVFQLFLKQKRSSVQEKQNMD